MILTWFSEKTSDEYRQGVLLLKGELKCCGSGEGTTKLLEAVEDSQRAPKSTLVCEMIIEEKMTG